MDQDNGILRKRGPNVQLGIDILHPLAFRLLFDSNPRTRFGSQLQLCITSTFLNPKPKQKKNFLSLKLKQYYR